MDENTRKPEYTDPDWRFLIRDRQVKWARMRRELDAKGVRSVRLPAFGEPVGAADFTPELLIYPIHAQVPRGTIIVCAGGGFRFKSANEAEPVADFFHGRGLNAAILDYTVHPDDAFGDEDAHAVQRASGAEALYAVRWLRAHAPELGIRPDKIAIGGFSAGGMISAWAGSRFDGGNPEAADPALRASSRPDAVVMIYSSFPMMTDALGGPFSPYGAEAQRARAEYAPDAALRPECPPFFLAQTAADDPRRLMLFGLRLAALGISFEAHLFERGGHGGALYDGGEDSPYEPHTSMWPHLAASWLINNLNF